METSDHLFLHPLISSTHLHSVDLFVVGDGLGHRPEAQLLREGALRLLLLPTDAAADAPPDGGVVEQTLEAAALPRRRAAERCSAAARLVEAAVGRRAGRGRRRDGRALLRPRPKEIAARPRSHRQILLLSGTDVCIRARQLCGGGGGHRGLLCDGREDALAARGPRNVSALIPHNLERGTRTNRLLLLLLFLNDRRAGSGESDLLEVDTLGLRSVDDGKEVVAAVGRLERDLLLQAMPAAAAAVGFVVVVSDRVFAGGRGVVSRRH